MHEIRKMIDILSEDDLFEMSNIRKNESGLPMNIYVSSGGSVNHQHGPRIKVMPTSANNMNPHQTVSVMLKQNITSDDVVGYSQLSSDDLSEIRNYINLNYETLIQYWEDTISTAEMISKLKKLENKEPK